MLTYEIVATLAYKSQLFFQETSNIIQRLLTANISRFFVKLSLLHKFAFCLVGPIGLYKFQNYAQTLFINLTSLVQLLP